MIEGNNQYYQYVATASRNDGCYFHNNGLQRVMLSLSIQEAFAQLAAVPVPPVRVSRGVFESKSRIEQFAGVPVLIVSADDVPADRYGFNSFVMNQVKARSGNDILSAYHLMEAFENYRDVLCCYRAHEAEEYGVIDPKAVIYPLNHPRAEGMNEKTYVPARAAIVFAPSRKVTVERDLENGLGLRRTKGDAMMQDYEPWQYFQLCHELAHVAGAAEPQADYIASLMCRQAFPHSIVTDINADMRALEAMLCVTKLACAMTNDRQDTCCTLEDYGWPMAEANDLAMGIDAETLAGMTEDNILQQRFERYDHSIARIFPIGAIARDTGLSERILSGDSALLRKGAMALTRQVRKHSKNTEIHGIADRFAFAARRIHAGAQAYGVVAESAFPCHRPL